MHDAIWLLLALAAVALLTITTAAICWRARRREPGDHRAPGRARRPRRDPHDPVIGGGFSSIGERWQAGAFDRPDDVQDDQDDGGDDRPGD
jgi:hypothetical protein